MTSRNALWLLLVFAATPILHGAADEPPTPQQLIDTAHRVSDLTSLGPYVLTAKVTVDSADQKTRKTGRLMIARDRGRTREELEVGGVREVRFFLHGKQYISPSPGWLPGLELMDFDKRWDPVHFVVSRFNGVRRDQVEGVDAWCLTRDSGEHEPSPCFDAVKGVYLGHIPNEKMSTEYFDFTSVGNQLFYPRRAVILRPDFGRIEVNSVEVTPGPAKEDLFTPPESAIEIETCRGPNFLKPLYTPEPLYPGEERKQKKQGTAYLSVIIDKDGKVAAAQVLTAPTEGFAREAVAIVRKWRFQPVTCAGRPVNQEANIQVDFHLY